MTSCCIIASGAAKTEEATGSEVAGDVKKSAQQSKPIGYVASARDFVAAIVDKPLAVAQE